MGKELLYMYIDKFYGFEKAGFNFSASFEFCVHGTKQLVLQKKDCDKQLMKEFWGKNISDISMLIGDNGSGKTTLMKMICRWICCVSQKCLPQEKGVLVFREDKSIGYIAFEKGDKLEILVDIPEAEEYNISRMCDFTKDLCLLYFSNTITELNMKNEILRDCSLYRRILEANEGENLSNGNVVEKYSRKEFQNQIETALREKINDFPVHYLQIAVQHLKFETIQEYQTNEIKDVSKNLKRLWEHYFSSEYENMVKEKQLIIELLKALLIGVIKYILRVHYTKCILYRLNKMIDYYYLHCKSEGIENGFEEFKEFFKDIILDNISDEDKDKREDDIEQFIDLLIAEIHCTDGLLLRIGDFGFEGKDISVGEINIDSDSREKFKRFWEAYKNIDSYMEGVDFSWDASSGERNWVSLFSILTNVSGENVWLLLDEPDNTLHPDWQRKILSKIIEVCNGKNYYQKKVQIWIATHSPIMLSDMPGNSVIYLKDKENIGRQFQETFGQNIYALFNHAFFLHDGVIGTFASEKIEKVLDLLPEIEKTLFKGESGSDEIEQARLNLKYCKALVDLLAEPIFKRHLMDSILFLQKEIEKKE